VSERPLRICFTAYRGNMQSGGQGIYLWFLARELVRQGHQVDVIVGPPWPDPMPFAGAVERVDNEMYWAKWFLREPAKLLPRPDPLRVFSPLQFYEFAASRIGFLPEPFAFSLRAFDALARRLRGGARYDLVHDVQSLGYGLLAIRALGLPVVSTVHHPLTVDRRAAFARARSFRQRLGAWEFYPVEMQGVVARRLDRIFTSSEVSARQIDQDFRVRAPRVVNLANGLDTTLFAPDPSAVRSETEVLCVGRASDPNKGIPALLRALAELPERVTLTLVDSEQSDARQWAARLGCGDRLRITGRIDTPSLVRLYQRAALVVVPSRFEGFGLPATEAMACGAPLVATRAGALPEVVGGDGGVLVPAEDPAALAAAIHTLIEQPEARRALGARARARVERNDAWPRIAERTVREYRAVLAERRPAEQRLAEAAGRNGRGQEEAERAWQAGP
jgi:glycosyltransferase involved in cell wall biosynthesis